MNIIILAGLFRQVAEPETGEYPVGYSDILLDSPYSLPNSYIKAYCDKFPHISEKYHLKTVNITDDRPVDPLHGLGEEVQITENHVDELLRDNPAAVCFSAYCWNIDAVLRACGKIKNNNPETITVIGGRMINSIYKKILKENPVDFIVHGEGEIPLSNLLSVSFSKERSIHGVSFVNSQGRICTGILPQPIMNLDSIPSPYAEGVAKPSRSGMMLELSRGCVNDCGYCAWNSSKIRRHFSFRRIQSDLQWAVANLVRHITILDSAINYEPESLENFIAAAAVSDPHRQLSFTYNLRHELVTSHQIELLGRINTRQILLGMESLSEQALDCSSRSRFDRAKFGEAVELISRISPPVIGVILGLPGDTLEGFKNTMDFLARLHSSHGSRLIGAVLVSLLQVFPGTGLSRKKQKLRIRCKKTGIPYIIENYSFSKQDLYEAVRYIFRLRIQYPLPVKQVEGISSILKIKGIESLKDEILMLLKPWKKGQRINGWLLKDAHPVFDGEGVSVFTFSKKTDIHVRVDKRDENKNSYLKTKKFNIYFTGQINQQYHRDIDELMCIIASLIAENE
jgi:radical SAM superfamily enzyme YgiQ (UPF0313 family)